MSSPADLFFGSLTKLVKALVLNKHLVEAVFGVTLYYDEAHTTSAFVFHRYDRPAHVSPQQSIVKKIDFRIPFDPAKQGKAFLHVDLDETPALTASSIIAKFGQPLEVQVSTPQESMGTGTAVTYVYSLNQWQLFFSFSPPPKENLIAVSMERGNREPK